MAAISTIIGAVGLGIAGFGAYQNYSNQSRASEAQSQAAQKQAEIAAIQAKNVDVQEQQLDLQSSQQLLQNQTQRDVIGLQKQSDAIRMQAAEMDATRRRREAVRADIVSRANSLTAATNQGAASPGSTAVAQSAANITGQSNTNILGITQNLDAGKSLYDINTQISDRYLAASRQNDTFVGQSKDLQKQVLGNQRQIYQLGGEANLLNSQAAQFQSNAAIGQGLTSIGSALFNNYDKINSMTQFFTGGGSTNQYFQPTDI